MKALDTKVKDFIVALWLKINKLVAMVKVIMLAMGKSLKGGAFEYKGKTKVLELKLDA